MKKKYSALAIISGLVAAAALTGCQQGSKVIHVQLVPSVNPATLLDLAGKLTPFLNGYVKDSGYTFNIDVGSSYSATTSALVANQIDAAFLPAGNYAQVSIENKGTVDVILSAARAGYKVQADDFKGFDDASKEKQRKAMNGEITADGTAVTTANASSAYAYRGQQSATKVSYYSGVVYCLRDSARTKLGLPKLDLNDDGTVTIKEMHDAGALVGIMDTGSSSGYVYPRKLFDDAGYTKGFVDKSTYKTLSDADKALAIQSVAQGTYNEAVDKLMTGQIDVTLGYFDTRYGAAYDTPSATAYYKNDKVFTDTYTIAITDPIMNDTVSVYHTLGQAQRDAISKAFKAAAADGDKNTDGTAAYYLYHIYSHTGYNDAKDADYDKAREMYQWVSAHTTK